MLDCGAQAFTCCAARFLSQVLDRGAQAETRGVVTAINARRFHGRQRARKSSSRVAVASFSDFGDFVFSTEIRKAERERARRQAGTQAGRWAIFIFSPAAIFAEFVCTVAAFVVNPEPHTGASPSARLCVGLKNTKMKTDKRAADGRVVNGRE
jgi:hypothetical protein